MFKFLKRTNILFIFAITLFFALTVFCACSSNNNKLSKLNINTNKDDLELITSNTLTVACAPGYVPYEYIEDGEFKGFDVDVIKMFAKSLDLDLNILPYKYSSILEEIKQAKNFDVAICAIVESPDKEEYINFSKPYLTNKEHLIIMTKANTDINENNYENKIKESRKIAVLENSSFETYIRKKYPNVNIEYVDSKEKSLELLNNNQVSFVLADSEYNDLIKDPNLYIKLFDTEVTENICVAIPKDKPNLLNAINEVIDARTKDFTLESYRNQYFK